MSREIIFECEEQSKCDEKPTNEEEKSTCPKSHNLQNTSILKKSAAFITIRSV
jgi:hypothetical protein